MNDQPLQKIIPSYPYIQYSDDFDLQAFFRSYNSIAQGYLNWFNNTPLSVYTSPEINGDLLDWIGSKFYNYKRPTISYSYPYPAIGALSTFFFTELYLTQYSKHSDQDVYIVNDDLYKRCLTWNLYRGDGFQSTVQWLRKRVARFLYGVDGTDISNDYLQYVSITFPETMSNSGSFASFFFSQMYFTELKINPGIAKGIIVIEIEDSIIAQQFQQLFEEGFLNHPFQPQILVNLI